MSESYKKWIKQKLEKLQAIDCYSAGATPETVAKQLGVTTKQIIKLDFNENLFMPRVKQAKLVKELAEEIDLRMYPEDEEAKLREKLSQLHESSKGLPCGWQCKRRINRPHHKTLRRKRRHRGLVYTNIHVSQGSALNAKKANTSQVPLLSNLQLDVKGMLSKFSDKTRLLYLCSPNSPTATQYKAEDIEALAKAFPGIVILDEAYGEFADYSFVPRIKEFENMIILRTFSKAFGLAALRLGYAVANPELAKILTEKAPLPYPVSGFTLKNGRQNAGQR